MNDDGNLRTGKVMIGQAENTRCSCDYCQMYREYECPEEACALLMYECLVWKAARSWRPLSKTESACQAGVAEPGVSHVMHERCKDECAHERAQGVQGCMCA